MSDFAEYIIVHYDELWVVSSGDRLLAGFPSRNDAEAMVHWEVKARRHEGKASRVIIEDGLKRQVIHRPRYAGYASQDAAALTAPVASILTSKSL